MRRTDSKGRNDSKGNPERVRKATPSEKAPANKATREEKVDQALEKLLEYLKRTRGFDFTSYKRSSLSRRIYKRMQDVGLADCESYMDYLEVNPEEFAHLFNTILINVTDFFRDPQAWEGLQEEIIPRILQNKRAGEAIRAWSAACASGEEAYSITMLLADALGMDDFRERAKVYATDVDEDALKQARQAAYSPDQVRSVPPDLLQKYFESSGGRYVFNKDLRRSIIFGRHDLIQDPPISKIDLVICRNSLMYINAEAQNKVLAGFAFSLNDSGFLFLGKAETLLMRNNAFTPFDLKRRIFARVPRRLPRESVALAVGGLNEQAVDGLGELGNLREAALDADAIPQLLFDANGTLIFANEPARTLFSLTGADVGRPVQDLEVSFRPVELRSRIEQAYIERRAVVTREVEFAALGTQHFIDLTVIPLFDAFGNPLGAKAIYTDVTRSKRLEEELRQSHQELETAYEELQSANEELETTNEELQSTVEELETTNEELHSTNEELETMNEELQSTNEELQATNEQLRERGDELNELNAFNEVILQRMPEGMIVVDQDLGVTAWNKAAEDLWGLRAEEVKGKSLLILDTGLPIDKLRQPIRSVLKGQSEMERIKTGATNRRGKRIELAATVSPLPRPGQARQGIIIMMEETKDAGGE